MLSVAEALAAVMDKTSPLPAENTVLRPEVLGRILGEDVHSDLNSPPFAKALRDGYAVRVADVSADGATLRVAGEVPAGAVYGIALQPGDAVRIFTGAPLPRHADAVVMQEDCGRDGTHVRVPGGLKPGQYILPQAAEYRSGEVILPTGAKVGPQELGLLASLGRVEALLRAVPRVAVLSSGSEIVEPPTRPTGAQIRNSNGPMLLAQAQRAGASPEYLGIARDDQRELADRVRAGLDRADIVIVSGGVSVGDYDYLPHVLKDLGVEMHFHQVSMKPGKPVMFGSRHDKLLFGLPGNPVGAFMGFELFVRPAIDRLRGEQSAELPWASLPLADDFSTANDRPTYFPAKLTTAGGALSVHPNGGMNSANLHSLTGADAIMAVPAGPVRLKAGEPVNTLRLAR